jgi:hypothetical protein
VRRRTVSTASNALSTNLLRSLTQCTSGEIFSSDEIDILHKKNQAELLGCEGIEWIPNPNAPTGAQIWSLTRQDKPELQTLLIDQGTPQKSAYVLAIRTWDQISVDREAAKQDQLDKLKGL